MSDQNTTQELGLPPTWAPMPLGYLLAKIGVQTERGSETGHLLIIDGPTGRQAFAFDAAAFRQLGQRIIEQTTGLEIAKDMPNGQQP